MTTCKHQNLVLLPQAAARLRCRHCHLTLTVEDLADGCCPECLESGRVCRDDFETIPSPDATRYQCEQCGALIEVAVHARK